MKTFAIALVLFSVGFSANASAFQYVPRASAVVFGAEVARSVKLSTLKTVEVNKNQGYGQKVNEYANVKTSNEYRR